MNLAIIARLILSYPLLKLGFLNRRLSRYTGKGFLILMYHRIVPEHMVDWKIQPGMYVTDASFDMHLRFLKRHFSVVSLKDLIPYDSNGYQTNRPLCAITFDDGWLDFYEYAYPLLEKYSLPATVFLPTDFIDSGRLFWTDRVPYLLEQGSQLEGLDLSDVPGLADMAERIVALEGSREERLENSIKILKQYPQPEIDHLLDRFAPGAASRSFFSWDEARKMKESGLVSFGSHTCSHSILTVLETGTIFKELSMSRQKLLEHGVCDRDFVPFCYPNGNFNDKIVEMVKQAGYDLAVTTVNGWNRKGEDPFILRRTGIHDDMTCRESLFAWQLLNLP